jgi:signal peptidase I
MSNNPGENVNSEISKSDGLTDEENKVIFETEKTDDTNNVYIIEETKDTEDSFDFEEPYDNKSEELSRKMKRSNRKGVIFDLIFYALLIFVCIYIIPNYVIQRTVVDGTSMENTLSNGDQLYVEKLSYHFDALKRFDIIVFYPHGRENGDYYVKRIIGLPGETVQIIGSDIYIDGKILKENYGKDPIMDQGRAAEPIKLTEDEYFVLGDNRSVSKDSRSEDVGNVEKDNIGGRVILRIKPISKFGTVD